MSGTYSGAFPTTGHLELLVKAQEGLNRVIPVIDKAEACGVDCGEYRQGVEYMGKKIDLFRAQFFPDTLAGPNPSGIPGYGG